MIPAWERQEGESPRAYHAFTLYRDLGPQRSLSQVAQRLHDAGAKTGRTSGRIRQWCVEYRWVDRAAAWDDELDRRAREDQAAEILAMRKRHASEAVALQSKAVSALNKLNAEDLKEEPFAILRYIVDGAKLERLARGEPDLITEERGADPDYATTRNLLKDPRAQRLAEEYLRAAAHRKPGALGLDG